MALTDEQIAERVFAGSLPVMAAVIAVVGLVGAAYDKVSGVSYLAWPLWLLLWSLVPLSALAGTTSWVALLKMQGSTVKISVVVWLVRSLIVGTCLVILAFVAYL